MTSSKLAAILLMALYLPAAWAQAKKVSTAEDARIYREAMVWFKKAEALIGTPQENSEEQATLFRKTLEIKPDFLEAHFNLGLVYANQRKMKEAAEQFEAVRRLEPKIEGIHFLLASTYRDLGNTEAARAALREGLERAPNDLKLLRSLAFIEQGGGDEASAISLLERIAALDKGDAEALLGLAVLYQKRSRLDDAAARYRQLLDLEPLSFAGHFNLGLIRWKQGKTREAIAELEAAKAISPANPDLLERLGDLYASDNRNAEAADSYRSALEKAPEREPLLARLAFTLAALNRPAEAVSVLERAVALNPKNPSTLYLLGDLYSELKRNDEAVAAYRRSLEIDPRQKEVHYNLGTLYAERDELGEARRELAAAVDLDPGYAAAWSNLALVLEKLPDDDAAAAAHEKVVALGKARAVNYFHLGILYAKKNRPDPAITNLARALELEPERYRQILRDELKKVHSVLDSIRYSERFARLLTGPPPTPARPER